VKNLSLSKKACIAVVFCAAMAIVSRAQTFTSLVNFNGANGASPYASLTQGTDGDFYGTTGAGGANGNCNISGGCGTIFKVTPGGTLTTLYSFCSQAGCTDGVSPQAGLVRATDGNFYGTTYSGGASGNCSGGCGTVFKVTPGGMPTTLHSFAMTDGAFPQAGLVQGTDGNFYGTTSYSGVGAGTVFKMTPAGALTTLYTFSGLDGAFPQAGLVQGIDGNFYGTTPYGGPNGGGTVFKITSVGALTTLYSFCSYYACFDGAGPEAGLVQGTDGNFYGTTYRGGYYHSGTVFEITPNGSLPTLYTFSGVDGAFPQAGLVQATDGNFYGSTSLGGTNGDGTLFKITSFRSRTTLHSFNGFDGSLPYAGLVQGTDGTFYGTTYGGGTHSNNCTDSGCGTVFSLSVGLDPFVETQPTSGKLGTPVIILGTNLTGATSVTFNGTPAAFNVVSPSEITTNVPAGATTGLVQVTTPSGTLSSNTTFQITSPVQFVPVAPCRLVDTRTESGGSGPIQGGTFESFNLPQLAQQKGCANLAAAAAYSLNVTVVPSYFFLRYLTIWPTGEVMPYVSTMNSLDGRVKANAAIVPAGSNAVSVYVTDTTDLVLDIDGYFVQAGQSTLAFYPLPPCRVADTRNPKEPSGLGPPYLTGGVPRDFPILEASTCNIPNTAQAYSLNFTAVPHGLLNYLTVWPTGQSQPYVSTLNAPTGTVVANAAIVPAGTGGKVSTYATDDTDLIIDVNGYFAPPGQNGLSLYPMVPCRVATSGPFSGTLNPPVDVVGSPCGVPSQSEAYVFNATVVPVNVLGYLTLWPDGGIQPYVSTLNAYDGAITSNMAIVPAGNQGKVDAFAGYGLTYLNLDISGYFAP
jgi:uncharacterized repeat protein (TIGR03803 family)